MFWVAYAAQQWYLKFYDTWVARDAEGTIFGRDPDTIVSDPYGAQRYKKGLAFPVTCCWNGLAVFDAEPLQQSGLMFRRASSLCAVDISMLVRQPTAAEVASRHA